MQQRRHFRDHLEAEEDREHEDRDLEGQEEPVAHATASLACGSVAWGEPCFPHEPPSLGDAPTYAPLRSPRSSESKRGETSRFPPAPSPRPLTRPPPFPASRKHRL